MCEERPSILKHYMDKNGIKYELDKGNYRNLRVYTENLTERQVLVIKKLARIDGFKYQVGFGLISLDLGHYGGLK